MKIASSFLAIVLTLIAALALLTPTLAQVGNPHPAEPIILTDGQEEYPLGLHLDILEDPSGELTIDQVSSPEFDGQFSPSQVEVPNYGFTDSAYWVRLKLDNKSQKINEWLLESGFANIHYMDMYTPLSDGKGYSVKQSGTLRPVTSRDILYPDIVFKLNLLPGSQETIYLRFQNGASMTMPLTLMTPTAFLSYALAEQIGFGIFFGIMIGLLFYNLFLLLSVREINYLYFVLVLASFTIEEATYNGYLVILAKSTGYLYQTYAQELSFSLIIISTILFADSFLELKRQISRLHKLNIVLLAAWVGLLLLTPFIHYHVVARIGVPLAIISLAFVCVAGATTLLRGFRPARFFMVAWLGMLLGLFQVLFVRMGLTSSSFLSENAYRFGLVWLAVCWSIALADRINLLKAETDKANSSLMSSEHRLSQILEGLPIGVVVYGKDHKPTFGNRRTTEILSNPDKGIQPDISAGRTLENAIDYFSLQKAGSDEPYPLENFPIYTALKGVSASADDIEAKLGDRSVSLEIWASPVRDEMGSVESAVVAFQDVTQRKQAEMAMRSSETRFRVIAENNFDGIAFMGPDRKVLYASPSYQRLVGKTGEELVGQSGIGLVHPDDREYTAQKFTEVLQHPNTRICAEYRIPHKEGSWIWVETFAINLLDDPDVQAVVLNSHNITERKQAEAELIEYRRNLEVLVNQRTEELQVSNQQLAIEASERKLLALSLQQRIDWLSAVNTIHQTLTGMTGLPVAYEELSTKIIQLLDADIVFILRWDHSNQADESICYSPSGIIYVDKNIVQDAFLKGSELRREIETGKSVTWHFNQAKPLPVQLMEYYRAHGIQASIFAPMVIRQSVIGFLGVARAKPSPDFLPLEIGLVERMAFDLADLTNVASLQDQALSLAAVNERNRLARDLHDSVSQMLFSANLVADVLPQIWRRDPERGLQSLDKLRRLARGAQAEMRTMLLELRPAAVVNTPLGELLAQLTEAITSRSGLPFQLFIERVPSLPENVHTGFYRISQEALNNVVKHAQARQVSVSLFVNQLSQGDSLDEEIKLVIQDDGVGFPIKNDSAARLGIGIMRERAAAIQATLTIESRPGHGTKVSLAWLNRSENHL